MSRSAMSGAWHRTWPVRTRRGHQPAGLQEACNARLTWIEGRVAPCSSSSLCFALVLAGPAAAQPQELIPGLTYERKVEFTTRGPVVANVLTVPRPGGLWQLKPVLSNESMLGTERLTAIEQRYSAGATVAGINGDLFGYQRGAERRS